MKVKLVEKFFRNIFPNKIGSTEDELRQVEEHTIDDSALLLTFRLTQIFGLQPILINKTNSKTYNVSISTVMYLLNILTCVIINGGFFYALFISVILSRDSAWKFSFEDKIDDLLIALAVVPLSVVSIYSSLYGTVRVRCILHCLERIKKIKEDINKLPYGHVSSGRKMCCLILLVIFVPFIRQVNFTWLSGGLSTWICPILTVIGVLLEIQFLLLVQSLNSSFRAINRELKDVLSQLSFKYSRRIPKTKIALQIHHLMICFVESCNMLRKINSNESFLLLCHVIIFPLHILIRLYYLFSTIFTIEEDPHQLFFIICEAVDCFYHVFKTFLIIQPCHQTQEEVDETKHLVAEFMCHLQSEDDLLFESVETFYKQLMLNNYTFTAMGICDIGRHLVSKIVGLAITLIMVLLF